MSWEIVDDRLTFSKIWVQEWDIKLDRASSTMWVCPRMGTVLFKKQGVDKQQHMDHGYTCKGIYLPTYLPTSLSVCMSVCLYIYIYTCVVWCMMCIYIYIPI